MLRNDIMRKGSRKIFATHIVTWQMGMVCAKDAESRIKEDERQRKRKRVKIEFDSYEFSCLFQNL